MSLFRRSASRARQRRQPNNEPEQARKVFSYHAQRVEEDSNTGRYTQRSSPAAAIANFGRFWLKRFGIALVVAVLVAVTINVLRLSNNADVRTLSGGGAFLHDKAAYHAAASKALASSIWNRNKITVDTAKISRDMRHQFPELSSVSVTLPLLAHRPLVYIQAAQPALVMISGNGFFVVDTTGKALIKVSSQEVSQLNLPEVTDKSGLKLSVNRQVLTAANVNFIQTVTAQLDAKHFTVSNMTLPAAANELDVNVAGKPYFIKFNLQTNDARQQSGTFLAAQAQLDKQHVTPGKYIDVRVDGRAYYQ